MKELELELLDQIEKATRMLGDYTILEGNDQVYPKEINRVCALLKKLRKIAVTRSCYEKIIESYRASMIEAIEEAFQEEDK